MKLYTEEQVRVAMSLSFIKDTIATENQIIDSLKFIELPSDKKIEKQWNNNPMIMNDLYVKGIIYGAIWMKEQIKEQADGN